MGGCCFAPVLPSFMYRIALNCVLTCHGYGYTRRLGFGVAVYKDCGVKGPSVVCRSGSVVIYCGPTKVTARAEHVKRRSVRDFVEGCETTGGRPPCINVIRELSRPMRNIVMFTGGRGTTTSLDERVGRRAARGCCHTTDENRKISKTSGRRTGGRSGRSLT